MPTITADHILHLSDRRSALILDSDGELGTAHYSDLEFAGDDTTDPEAQAMLADGGYCLAVYGNLLDQTDGDDVETDEDNVITGLTREAAQAIADSLNDTFRVLLAEADVKRTTAEAETAALRRAQAVARLVDAFGGNQSAAARFLGLDQSTVNKLVRKARAARA
jgi:DNA-binding protein Fis